MIWDSFLLKIYEFLDRLKQKSLVAWLSILGLLQGMMWVLEYASDNFLIPDWFQNIDEYAIARTLILFIGYVVGKRTFEPLKTLREKATTEPKEELA